MVMPVAPGSPGAAPPVASPAGSSPIRPTQNAGSMVNGIAKVRQAIKLLASAMPDVMENQELADEIMNAIKKLGAKAPANQTTAGSESSQLAMLARNAQAQAPMLALSRMQGQGQGTPNGGQ